MIIFGFRRCDKPFKSVSMAPGGLWDRVQGSHGREREEKKACPPPLSAARALCVGYKTSRKLIFTVGFGFSMVDKHYKRVADLLGPLWSLVLVSHGRERGL